MPLAVKKNPLQNKSYLFCLGTALGFEQTSHKVMWGLIYGANLALIVQTAQAILSLEKK